MKLKKFILSSVVFSFAVVSSQGFTLIGPWAPWQVARIGYQLAGDIGGPVPLGEEFRLTIKTITYGFSPEFVNWFGQTGMDAVEEAVEVFTDLGDLSVIDPNAFPLNSTRFNATAFQLNMIDLKTWSMQNLIEFAGLTDCERYVFTLRELEDINNVRFYTVISYNYDPVTLRPTFHINGHLYTYTTIFDNDTDLAFPVVQPVDPLADISTPVAARENFFPQGRYFTSLTRDDVGGLKYIYSTSNYNVETLPAGTTQSAGGSGVSQITGGSTAWSPILPNLTNQVAVVSTNLIDRGLRPGIGRLNFVKTEYDTVFGDFLPVFVRDADFVINNGIPTRQNVERFLATGPDAIFDAADFDDTALVLRSAVAYTSFDPISAVVGDIGPGSINAPYIFTYSKRGITYRNSRPFFLDQDPGSELLNWGSYDHTDKPPVLYPDTASVLNLQELVSSSSAGSGSWIPVPAAVAVTDPNAAGGGNVTTP